MPTSPKPPSIPGEIAAPSLLLGVLSAALYWQIQRLVAGDRSVSELGLAVALVLGILLAIGCLWQLLALSRVYGDALEKLQTQDQRHVLDELGQAAEALQHYAIFMLDPRGYIVSWDRDAERLLGYSSGDVIARHISAFYSESETRQGQPAHDLAIATTEGRFDDERWMVRKDGFRYKASVALVAIRDPSGDLCGFTHVVREHLAESPVEPVGMLRA